MIALTRSDQRRSGMFRLVGAGGSLRRLTFSWCSRAVRRSSKQQKNGNIRTKRAKDWGKKGRWANERVVVYEERLQETKTENTSRLPPTYPPTYPVRKDGVRYGAVVMAGGSAFLVWASYGPVWSRMASYGLLWRCAPYGPSLAPTDIGKVRPPNPL